MLAVIVRARAWAVVVAALAVSACSADSGTYLEVHADLDAGVQPFDHLELFFTAGSAAAPEVTANAGARVQSQATTYVRDFGPSDSWSGAATSATTFFVENNSHKQLGEYVAVIASDDSGIVGFAQLDDLELGSGRPEKMVVELTPQNTPSVGTSTGWQPGAETWSASATSETCLRVTTDTGTTFVVADGDTDCDGLPDGSDCQPTMYCNGSEPPDRDANAPYDPCLKICESSDGSGSGSGSGRSGPCEVSLCSNLAATGSDVSTPESCAAAAHDPTESVCLAACPNDLASCVALTTYDLLSDCLATGVVAGAAPSFVCDVSALSSDGDTICESGSDEYAAHTVPLVGVTSCKIVDQASIDGIFLVSPDAGTFATTTGRTVSLTYNAAPDVTTPTVCDFHFAFAYPLLAGANSGFPTPADILITVPFTVNGNTQIDTVVISLVPTPATNSLNDCSLDPVCTTMAAPVTCSAH